MGKPCIRSLRPGLRRHTSARPAAHTPGHRAEHQGTACGTRRCLSARANRCLHTRFTALISTLRSPRLHSCNTGTRAAGATSPASCSKSATPPAAWSGPSRLTRSRTRTHSSSAPRQVSARAPLRGQVAHPTAVMSDPTHMACCLSLLQAYDSKRAHASAAVVRRAEARLPCRTSSCVRGKRPDAPHHSRLCSCFCPPGPQSAARARASTRRQAPAERASPARPPLAAPTPPVRAARQRSSPTQTALPA